jgi:hypothetical protein
MNLFAARHACAPFVLRLRREEGRGRKQAIFYRRNDMRKTQCLYFSIDRTIPKLDVAGSIPVSRSML